MDELSEEAKDSIRFYVWGGWHNPEEVFNIIDDEVFDGECEDEEWLREEIDQEFEQKREAEQAWPMLTTFDRLDQVFTALRDRGVLARHRCGLTQQDGLQVIDGLHQEAGGKSSGIIGFCFYTYQDMEGAMEEDGLMRLAFGSFSTGEDSLAVGRLIQELLEHGGFKVEWDDTTMTRLLLSDFRWQRRSPLDGAS